MCLDGVDASSSPVVFRACVVPAIPQQRWSFNDNSRFQGTNVTNDGFSNFCFVAAPANTPGIAVVLGSCNSSTDTSSYSPEASVGAGAAGKALGQLVNYDQFGRCLDVTEFNVNKGFLISWPCKQSPGGLAWNQLWTVPTVPTGNTAGVTGTISTNTGSTVYCLNSPGSNAFGQYVTVVPCQVAPPAAMTWTRYENANTYAKSYRITDYWNQCLVPTDPTAVPPDFYTSKGAYQISKITVEPCTGSTLEKWNAPANIEVRAGKVSRLNKAQTEALIGTGAV